MKRTQIIHGSWRNEIVKVLPVRRARLEDGFVYNRFTLFCGPPGVGKSTVIRRITEVNPRFTYASPYTTRVARPGETDKIFVSLAEFRFRQAQGEFLSVNRMYGHLYGTPGAPIREALNTGRCPVIDWPIQRVPVLREVFNERLQVVYLLPPSMLELRTRLADGRDPDGQRLLNAQREIRAIMRGEFCEFIDVFAVTKLGHTDALVRDLLARL